ncbi:PIN domain-like protein [Athelia psychrophila]|uniref:PIN domain-like protein n=1 Tax=Athelia psychrophila TaxID=1759441 RepID=A0A167VM69_9AGAM|nr:PIN domain-like protein [Fibularhizoctonia sp. CBS 109695]
MYRHGTLLLLLYHQFTHYSMGVPGLWKLLCSTAENGSLAAMALRDGYERGQGSTFDIAIDTSGLICKCTPVFRHQHHTAGENPELRTIFFAMARLACLASQILFVYDGPHRPRTKRDKQVKSTPHWLTQAVQQMALLFGFANHTAPGEADAELAHLNLTGHAHIVMSNDIDCLLFSALHVIHFPNTKDDGDDVPPYSALAITQQKRLGRDGLLLVAVLAGGDYDTEGLKGCGAATAFGVARYGLGSSLLHLAESYGGQELSNALHGWRRELRYALRHDTHNHIGRKNPALADAVHEAFPSHAVLHAYAQPLTSWGQGRAFCPPPYGSGQPDVEKLAMFCLQKFGWNAEAVHCKFAKNLWPGICMQMPLKKTYDYKPRFNPSCAIHMTKCNKKSANTTQYYRISFNTSSLTDTAEQGIQASDYNPGSTPNQPDISATAETIIPVPLAIVLRTLPAMVHPDHRPLIPPSLALSV